MIDSDGRSRSYGRPDPSLRPVTTRLVDRLVPWNIVRSPSLGIGEAYMDGRLSVENRGGILDMLALVGFNSRWSADSPPQLSWRGIVRPDQRDPCVVSWIFHPFSLPFGELLRLGYPSEGASFPRHAGTNIAGARLKEAMKAKGLARGM